MIGTSTNVLRCFIPRDTGRWSDFQRDSPIHWCFDHDSDGVIAIVALRSFEEPHFSSLSLGRVLISRFNVNADINCVKVTDHVRLSGLDLLL